MEHVNTSFEDKVVFEIRGDMEVAALELVVRGYSQIVRASSRCGNEDVAIELIQAANNLAGRIQISERSIAFAAALGIHHVEVAEVVHVLDERLGQIAEEAVIAFTFDSGAFAIHLSEDEMLEAQIYYPPDAN